HHYTSGPLKSPVFDCGDAQLSDLNVDAAHAEGALLAQLAKTQAKRSAQHALTICLGGDHSLAYPCILPYLDEYKDTLAVINLDAHLDVRHTAVGQAHNSGTAFRRLLDSGLTSYTVIGARD